MAPHFELNRSAAQLDNAEPMQALLANQATVNVVVAHVELLVIAVSATMNMLLQQAYPSLTAGARSRHMHTDGKSEQVSGTGVLGPALECVLQG